MELLLLQLTVDGVTHSLTIEDPGEGEVIGLVVDGLWVELVATEDEGAWLFEVDLYETRYRSKRGSYRLTALASPTILTDGTGTATVGVGGTDRDWAVTVALGAEEQPLPEVLDARGDLEVALIGPQGQGSWIVHDPVDSCIIWQGDTLVCTKVEERVEVVVRTLEPSRRGWHTSLLVLATTSGDVIHGRGPTSEYDFDVHWMPVPVAE